MKIMNQQEVFNYFFSKMDKLSVKYNINRYYLDPCSIGSMDDLVLFTEEAISTLFPENEYKHISCFEDVNVTENLFLFNGKRFSLKIDTKYGYVGQNFLSVFEEIASASGCILRAVNPTRVMVAGCQKSMRAAWAEGFPFHLHKDDFLHKNLNGNRFTREEVLSKFVLNEVISIDYYFTILLEGLNQYLEKEDICYNKFQVKTYVNDKKMCCISLSGDYNGDFQQRRSRTIFTNGFLNQIFLLKHCSSESGFSLNHIYETKKKKCESFLFKDYLANLGKIE